MDQNTIEIFITLYSLASIVLLIVFFVMTANINRVKKDIIDLRIIAMRYAKKDGIDLSNKFKKISDNWECPKCDFENSNNTSICERCKYKIE